MNKIAKKLLEIQAVFLRPDGFFTFTSGIKSPIYCDNRLVLSYPEVRTLIADELSALVKEKYPKAEMVIGVATAGIPHAVLIGDRLNLPAGYVREFAKGHGRANQIEGKCEKGTKVVIVEDLISTGKSIFKAKEVLKEAGAEILGSVAIFTYGVPKVAQAFKEQNLKLHTLTNFSQLIDTALKTKYINSDQLKVVKDWKLEFDNR